MNSIILSISLLASSFALANDGCYVMYQQGVMYPSLCISGSTEEGIGGSNARVVLFHVNSGTPEKCYRTSAISIDENSDMTLTLEGGVQLAMQKKSETAQGLAVGDIQVGKFKLMYEQLDKKTTDRFLENIKSSDICK